MGLQADREAIAVTFKRPKLPGPIDDPGAHRRPIVVLTSFHCVFAKAMTDPVFGRETVAVGKRSFAAGGRVTRVPVQYKVGRLDRIQNLGGLSSSGGVKAGVVFQEQRNAFLARFVGCLQSFSLIPKR